MHLVITGDTGSGKTTIAKELQRTLDVPLVGSGEIARELSRTDAATDLALKQGAQAPEQPMRAAIKARIEEADATRGGWILDGFPRTVEQLICLMQWTAAMPTFVYLEVNSWACLERLVARNRDHDNPDAIARRFDFFESETMKMIRLLQRGRVLIDVPHADERSTEDLVEEIREQL
jgi:adenylate kinase